ncbi:MAG: arsenite S-adenosylmethyltransferase [Firmicutes bacterium HGW-Firmicutes-20]|jgi:arsenite methyltransferase|nr:MAG: arsenite S-adenosylmethyltransferase [Firmicutes bacterium HGW-Firmicutes-20]PKM68945.1 MAG: arsenite S-adenosylmethyltransferase [Firmicutes bacterium HGW-Firmicutes-19]
MTTYKEEIKKHIRDNYGNIALKGLPCCGSSCCCNNEQLESDSLDINDLSTELGYSVNDLSEVPSGANLGLGCGNPIAIAKLKEGETVLDLGSGGGFDCFLARQQVGENGFVIGVDMTVEMIELSRNNAEKAGYHNVEFRLGEIENLPVDDESVDVIISNCVVNLSVDKERVFDESFRVLKHGGRLSISDILATAQLPEHIKEDLAMYAGCVSGAEHTENIAAMLAKSGFSLIKLTPKDNSREILTSWAEGKDIENYVASYIIEAQKE